MNLSYCAIIMALSLLRWRIVLSQPLQLAIGLEWLLHRLFHAARTHHQFEIPEDFGFMPSDVAFDGIVAEQLGQIALGHHQVD